MEELWGWYMPLNEADMLINYLVPFSFNSKFNSHFFIYSGILRLWSNFSIIKSLNSILLWNNILSYSFKIPLNFVKNLCTYWMWQLFISIMIFFYNRLEKFVKSLFLHTSIYEHTLSLKILISSQDWARPLLYYIAYWQTQKNVA